MKIRKGKVPGGEARTRPLLSKTSFLLGLLAVWLPGSLSGQETLTLAETLALALDSHPAVGRAMASQEAASAQVSLAESARFPWLASQASLARHQEPMVVAPLHAFDPLNPPTFDRNLIQGALTLGYTVFDGGARGARIRQAEAGEAAAGAGKVATDMDVLFQVSAAYLGILSGQDVLDAVERQRTALAAEVSRVGQFLQEGKAARVDLLRAEAALSRVDASAISAGANLDLARSRLARLTGLPLENIEGATLTGVEVALPGVPGRGQVLSDAGSVNPEIARARELLTGASAGVREAGAAWFPKVEAGGRYSDFGTLDGGHVQEWQGLVQISFPLFSGGSTKADRARARAEERRAAEALRLAELSVEDEAETALASVTETQALKAALEIAAKQSEEVARIEALALDAGAGTQSDFLRAQAELFQARAALAQARHGEILARIQLAQVRGELTLEWIQQHMEVVR